MTQVSFAHSANRTRASLRRTVTLLFLPLVLAACPNGPPAPGAAAGPTTVNPVAVRRLDNLKSMAASRDWAGIRAVEMSDCDDPQDAVCGESHAIRALACRKLATGAAPGARLSFLNCAVTDGRAALAAGTAVPAERRFDWEHELAWALFDRRQVVPRTTLCADNVALSEQADLLLRHRPNLPDARFLAASARFVNVAECGAVPPSVACADLAHAAALLTSSPGSADPRWSSLAAAVHLQQRDSQCLRI